MDEVVSKFMLKTCCADSRPNANKFALWYVGGLNERHRPTGSASEIYIEPILPCVGDVDCMIYRSYFAVSLDRQWVSVRDHLLRWPTACDTTDIVDVLKIHPVHHCPGYVFLSKIGELKKSKECQDYAFKEVVSNDPANYFTIQYSNHVGRRGPAKVFSKPFMTISERKLTVESVLCIRSLTWPDQAAEWKSRERMHGWPDEDTVERIVKAGCDIVMAVHQMCSNSRLKEFYDFYQYRLSFSRAEVVLLNSWTQKQQVVYHMVRSFVRGNGLDQMRDDSKCRIMSRYHIKTLMMRACELWPASDWQDFNVLRLSQRLLLELLSCFRLKTCEGYFIIEVNLFECDHDCQAFRDISGVLETVETLENLTSWFVDEYVKKCARLCPTNVQELFTDVSSIEKLDVATSALIKHWYGDQQSLLRQLKRYHRASADIGTFLHYNLKKGKYSEVLNGLERLLEMDQHLPNYFLASLYLRMSHHLRNACNDDILHLIRQCLTYDTLGTNEHELGLKRLIGVQVESRKKNRTTFEQTACQEPSERLIACAVERLMAYRKFFAWEFRPVCAFISEDVQALSEFRLGCYEKCLRILSNVDLFGPTTRVTISHCTTPLLDSCLTSFVGLQLIVASRRNGSDFSYVLICQRVLALYLSVQCYLKLKKSRQELKPILKTVLQVLEYLISVSRGLSYNCDTEIALLMYTYRKAVVHFRSAPSA